MQSKLRDVYNIIKRCQYYFSEDEIEFDVSKRLCDMTCAMRWIKSWRTLPPHIGYGYSFINSFIGHRIPIVIGRLETILELLKGDMNPYLKYKHTKYGKNIEDTLDFYKKCEHMKKSELRKEYELLMHRNYNFFEDLINIDTNEPKKNRYIGI